MSKFEETIRKQFHNREIRPSKNAWAKLEKQLPPSKPRKTGRIWYYVAAAIVGVMILSIIFTAKETEISNSQMVVEPLKIEKSVPITMKDNAPIETISEEITSVPKKEAVVMEHVTSETAHPPKQELNQEVASSSIPSLNESDEKLMDEWAESVALSIKQLPMDDEEALMEEVERLLYQAQMELQFKRKSDYSTIDAASLLEEVEFELNRTFRDKIFDFLGNEYEGLRTALASKFN